MLCEEGEEKKRIIIIIQIKYPSPEHTIHIYMYIESVYLVYSLFVYVSHFINLYSRVSNKSFLFSKDEWLSH